MCFWFVNSNTTLSINATASQVPQRTMKFTLPEDAFPALSLSKDKQAALIEEAETVVRETLAANEEFIAQGATFRDPRWRLIRAKEGLNVYRQRRSVDSTRVSNDFRRPSSPHSHSSSWSFKRRGRAESNFHWETSTEGERSESTDNTIQETMRRPEVSLMVLHGTVDGSLDDCMFGTFASTDQAWMWRSSHLNDRLDDARILATIRGPTHKDPFRFLGIKWFAKENPAVLSGIVQQRDFLIMEATGLTRDSKGNTVGYYLMHSVSLPGVPELSDMGIVRGEVSLCFIDRQSGAGKVEMFCRGFSDPRGGMLDRVSVGITSEALMCAAGVVDYAYIKKLTWLMKNKNATNPRASDRDVAFPRPTRCETCNKSFTKFSLTGVGAGAPCHICHLVVCGKCSVVKKMTMDVSSSGSVKQCALRFCLSCLLEAKEKSVWELALSGVETASECSSTSGSKRIAPHSKVPPNVFPPLQLSNSEKQAIVNYTDELVTETLMASEKFIAHHRKLNPERWKYVKTQDHLHVYRSRRRKSSSLDPQQLIPLSESSSVGSYASSDGLGASQTKVSSNSGSSTRRHDSDYLTDGSLLERARPNRVPIVVITGKMEGTVEDAAFGALADNEARWRLRDAYLGDEYDDQRILATLETPSAEDPFRFLGVKWATKVLGTFITQRDMVYVESTGITRDSNGERVAFVLMHSYGLDRVPELSEFGVIRARISSCVILRSHSERQVE
ncbi:Hypothetical protein PHPALM_17681, partial [Phytophthora palmivora]